MRKTYLHIELVPVEVAEKILKQQGSPAKRNGKRKLAVKRSGKAANGRPKVPKKTEVLVS
jgi:hypothetical protein